MKRTKSRAEAKFVDEVVQVQPPSGMSLKGKEKEIEAEPVEIQIPQRMSSIGKGKWKAKEMVQTEVEVESSIQWTERNWPDTPTLKWPKRALTKGNQERDESWSRPSVVGMFTVDLLDFTSSEDEGLTKDEGRESSESERTIRGEVVGDISC